MDVKLLKKQNGITLIALVITIIVLMIIASIAIGSIDGSTGTLEEANKTKKEAERSSIIEKIKADALVEKEKKNRELTFEEFKQVVQEGNYGTISGDILTSLEGNEINIRDLWTGKDIEEPEVAGISASDIANATNKDEYYGATVKGYTCTNNEAVQDWQIFYADQDNIYLIANDYIQMKYTPPSSSGKKIYADDGSSYQTPDDFNLAIIEYDGLNSITDTRIKKWLKYLDTYKDTGVERPDYMIMSYFLDIQAWSVFAGEKAEYAIGVPTLDLFVASYNETHANNKIDYKVIENTSKGDGYEIKWSTDSSYKHNINGIDSYNGLYYSQNMNKAYGMLLASTSNFNGNQIIQRIYGDGSLNLSSYNNDVPKGVRPVVCLNSSIRLEKQNDGFKIIN